MDKDILLIWSYGTILEVLEGFTFACWMWSFLNGMGPPGDLGEVQSTFCHEMGQVAQLLVEASGLSHGDPSPLGTFHTFLSLCTARRFPLGSIRRNKFQGVWTYSSLSPLIRVWTWAHGWSSLLPHLQNDTNDSVALGGYGNMVIGHQEPSASGGCSCHHRKQNEARASTTARPTGPRESAKSSGTRHWDELGRIIGFWWKRQREGIWAEEKVLGRHAEMGGYVMYFGKMELPGVWMHQGEVGVLRSDGQRPWFLVLGRHFQFKQGPRYSSGSSQQPSRSCPAVPGDGKVGSRTVLRGHGPLPCSFSPDAEAKAELNCKGKYMQREPEN